MSVFDDPNKELELLQAQLEEQEEWFRRELDSAKRMIGDAPKTPVKSQPKKPVKKPVQQPQKLEIEEEKPRKKGLGRLFLVAGLELLGILGILGYWLVHFLG